MKAGDYVALRRRVPPRYRKGLRGTVVSVDDNWAQVKLARGDFIEARDDQLTVLVKGEL